MMASKRRSIYDISPKTILLLWVIAIAGLFLPSVAWNMLPEDKWADDAARAWHRSQAEGRWIEPWVPIEQDRFQTAWLRCNSLEDALTLDRLIDNGILHTGNLVLAEGGVAWLP